MNRQRVVILLASVVGIVSIFLPWAEHPFRGSLIGWTPSMPAGKLASILFLIPLVVSILKDRTKSLSNVALIIASIGGVLAATVGIITINVLSKEITATIGFGLYLLILSGVSIPITSLLMKEKNNS